MGFRRYVVTPDILAILVVVAGAALRRPTHEWEE